MRHVTLYDICKKAGVSSATVSRVINESPLVVESTRKRVMKAIRDLGYHPSHAARMLARQRADTIAAIFPEIASGYFAEVLAGIDQASAQGRYHVITALSHGIEDEKDIITRFAQERRADGLIVMSLTPGLDALIKQTAKDGLPIVVIGRPTVARNVCSVSIDNVSGMEQAVVHLAARGHRRIAMIRGPLDNYDSQQRLEGARKAAAAHGLEIPDSMVWGSTFREESGREAIEKNMPRSGARPTAIIASNDELAMGARAALLELGLRIPEDVALVGFDDLPFARHLGLTTIRNPMKEIGQVSTDRLLARVRGEAVSPAHFTVPIQFLPRASTDVSI